MSFEVKAMPKQFVHVVREWERKWNRLTFGDAIPKGTTFKLTIGHQEMQKRFVDKGGRVWVGESTNLLAAGKKYLVTVSDSYDEVIMNLENPDQRSINEKK